MVMVLLQSIFFFLPCRDHVNERQRQRQPPRSLPRLYRKAQKLESKKETHQSSTNRTIIHYQHPMHEYISI